MVAATSPKVTITMYNDLPAGQIGLSQMWSGDIINAQSYLPEGTGPEILRYWFPADGKGMVDNDLMVDPQGRQESGAVASVPQPHARTRCRQAELHPDRLPAAAEFDRSRTRWSPTGFIPENLKSAIVKPEYFDVGYRLLELDAANDAAWHNVWRAFKAGGS